MGTRADFYIGTGETAEWIGSIGWDGYPDGIDNMILTAKTEEEFRQAITVHMVKRDDWTDPSFGWPWPWGDSHTTDYAYAFNQDKVVASRFGSEWFDPIDGEPTDSRGSAVFPNMKDRQNVTFGQHSGIIIVGA